jgi:hypothetical protein
MESEVDRPEKPVDYDTVAFALLNAISKGDKEDEKDHSLGVLLALLRFFSPNCSRTTRWQNQSG